MTDAVHLRRAVELSQASPEPVGCGVVLAQDGVVVAEAYNSQRADRVAVYHAEVKTLPAAHEATNSRALPQTVAYCSCEPCAMCLAALSYAKVARIVFYDRMQDLFPDDPQSRLDSHSFVQQLNFVPRLEQLRF